MKNFLNIDIDTGNIEDIGTEYTRCLFRAVVNCPSKVVIKIVPDHPKQHVKPMAFMVCWVLPSHQKAARDES
jgi:hypothetical protein